MFVLVGCQICRMKIRVEKSKADYVYLQVDC
jgi:hypothetical protein